MNAGLLVLVWRAQWLQLFVCLFVSLAALKSRVFDELCVCVCVRVCVFMFTVDLESLTNFVCVCVCVVCVSLAADLAESSL